MAERKFIMFRLENERYCAAVEQVRTISDMGVLSKIPAGPKYIAGLLNLRGEVIPVINLKRRFGLAEEVKSQRILIANNSVGFLVDDASQSITVAEEEVLAPPAVGFDENSSFVSSLAIHEDVLLLIIDLYEVVPQSVIETALGQV